jgi:hypothetical protein
MKLISGTADEAFLARPKMERRAKMKMKSQKK